MYLYLDVLCVMHGGAVLLARRSAGLRDQGDKSQIAYSVWHIYIYIYVYVYTYVYV